MALVKIEDVIYHLDHEFKKALDDVIHSVAPEVSYDRTAVFKLFLKRVYHHCSVWEEVPDDIVEKK